MSILNASDTPRKVPDNAHAVAMSSSVGPARAKAGAARTPTAKAISYKYTMRNVCQNTSRMIIDK